jgi:hypothetical protein
MIIVLADDVNRVSQDIYDRIVNELDRERIKCNRCGQYGFNINCYYYRSIRKPSGIEKILIVQLICRSCGKTHAVLLSTMIPWCSVEMSDAIRIIKAHGSSEIRLIYDDNPSISEDNIKHLRRIYFGEWKERLLSFCISIDNHLTENCVRYHDRQFLQNRCSSVLLITSDHIAPS